MRPYHFRFPINNLLTILLLITGCYKPPVRQHRYTVVSQFNETVLETNDKAHAYETAHNLTQLGRIFSSKPVYFVLEKP